MMLFLFVCSASFACANISSLSLINSMLKLIISGWKAICVCMGGSKNLFCAFTAKSSSQFCRGFNSLTAGPRSAVGRAPDSKVRGPGFDTQFGHILLFLLPLIYEGQLSVTG